MKIVKFRDYLVPLVLSGEKTSTWRLFDDKNLSVGDEIEMRVFVTNELFAKAKITEVIEKPFKDLTDEDKAGHESFGSNEEMYAKYTEYYGKTVGPDTSLKIIRFALKPGN